MCVRTEPRSQHACDCGGITWQPAYIFVLAQGSHKAATAAAGARPCSFLRGLVPIPDMHLCCVCAVCADVFTRAMLEAVLGRSGAGDDAAAGQRRRGLGAAARNAAVVAEAYPESEAHAGMGADGELAFGLWAAVKEDVCNAVIVTRQDLTRMQA